MTQVLERNLKEKKNLQFSAYGRAIFTEYTAWVTFGGISRSALEICLFITEMQMRYQICTFGDDRHTWVILIPTTTHIPHFVIVAHIELWIFAFFVISQSEQISNEVSKMHI